MVLLITSCCRYSESTFYCVAEDGELAACANNCPGVNPNSVVVGGTALVAATAIGGIGAFPIVGMLPIIGNYQALPKLPPSPKDWEERPR